MGLVSLMVYRFIQQRKPESTQTIAEIQAVEGYPVEVTKVKIQPFGMIRRYGGTVTGGEEASAVPAIGEYIKVIPVREGQQVSRDDAICELSRDNPAAGYRRGELALMNAERDLDRVQKLFDQGAVSKQTLDGVTLSRDLAKDGLANAEKLLYVRAPISGRITELTAEVGSFATPGIPLAKIVSNDYLRVRVDIPTGDRGLIMEGHGAVISGSGASRSGRVSRIADSADPKGRSFTTWIQLDERPDDRGFKPGMFVDVEIEVVKEDSAVTVASDALIRNGDGWRVFVVNQDRVRLTDVTVGGANPDAAWIRDGLPPNAIVVVSGANLLFDGAKIRVITKG